MAHQGGEEKHRSMVSSTGYCFSDVVSSGNLNLQSHLVNQLQSFDQSNQEIYNLTTGMEMIGFPPSKDLHHHHQHSDANSAMWKGFFGKPGNHDLGSGSGGRGPSSSKMINDEFKQTDFTSGGISDTTSDTMMGAPPDATTAWHDQNRLLVDDSSLRCVFPCEGNERPSQGLSLSLNSTNPSSIGLQSFELRQQDGFFGKSLGIQQQQEQAMMEEDGFLGKAANLHHHGHFQVRNSKYLGPAQELLNEFCNLGTKQTDSKPKIKPQKSSQWQDENTSSSSKKHSLYNLELLELQKRKAKLLSMLEEVDRRYRHYCDQMNAVVSSFEAVAGSGAATVYSALASKAMSRHFRCLRDGIVGQIKATKKAMGEKDTAAPGTTRGETPRLRLLDQTLRQHRALQQMSIMESHPWRPQRGLPERSVSVLRAWLFEHFLHPYPSDVDKHILARQTGLSRSQVSNWFINARVRLWKPMVEEMYLEETKEQDNHDNDDNNNNNINNNNNNFMAASDESGRPNHNSQPRPEDQKPTADQLVRMDSECLSSIINNPDKNDIRQHHHHHQPPLPPQHLSFERVADTFGAIEVLDFSSYNHHRPTAVSYAHHDNAHHNFGGGGGSSGGGGGVSLTLGLQQHGGSGGRGVRLAFSSESQGGSLFYPRDHIDDCQPVQFSLLDGEGQNLPYRNLMGAQLLHDLAG
ncbi:hypothetical protein U1Q18_019662 [Sarracenia purpurea var. burkii]